MTDFLDGLYGDTVCMSERTHTHLIRTTGDLGPQQLPSVQYIPPDQRPTPDPIIYAPSTRVLTQKNGTQWVQYGGQWYSFANGKKMGAYGQPLSQLQLVMLGNYLAGRHPNTGEANTG